MKTDLQAQKNRQVFIQTSINEARLTDNEKETNTDKNKHTNTQTHRHTDRKEWILS